MGAQGAGSESATYGEPSNPRGQLGSRRPPRGSAHRRRLPAGPGAGLQREELRRGVRAARSGAADPPALPPAPGRTAGGARAGPRPARRRRPPRRSRSRSRTGSGSLLSRSRAWGCSARDPHQAGSGVGAVLGEDDAEATPAVLQQQAHGAAPRRLVEAMHNGELLAGLPDLALRERQPGQRPARARRRSRRPSATHCRPGTGLAERIRWVFNISAVQNGTDALSSAAAPRHGRTPAKMPVGQPSQSGEGAGGAHHFDARRAEMHGRPAKVGEARPRSSRSSVAMTASMCLTGVDAGQVGSRSLSEPKLPPRRRTPRDLGVLEGGGERGRLDAHVPARGDDIRALVDGVANGGRGILGCRQGGRIEELHGHELDRRHVGAQAELLAATPRDRPAQQGAVAVLVADVTVDAITMKRAPWMSSTTPLPSSSTPLSPSRSSRELTHR